jgi:hypothetical protein
MSFFYIFSGMNAPQSHLSHENFSKESISGNLQFGVGVFLVLCSSHNTFVRYAGLTQNTKGLSDEPSAPNFIFERGAVRIVNALPMEDAPQYHEIEKYTKEYNEAFRMFVPKDWLEVNQLYRVTLKQPQISDSLGVNHLQTRTLSTTSHR